MGLFSRKQSEPAVSAELVVSEDLGVDVVRRAVAAGRSGDVPQVAELVASAATLDDAHAAIVAVAEHAPLSAVRAWHDAHRDDQLAAVVYAEALTLAAWKTRGHGMANTVSSTQFDDFFAYLKAADQALRPALADGPYAPHAFATAVLLARGLQQGPGEVAARCEYGVDLGGASFLRLHEQALQGLCAKWSGSHDLMFAFARDRFDPAAPSTLNELVCIGHLEYWLSGDAPLRYMSKREVAQEIAAAAASSWLPGFPDDTAGVSARNTFALAAHVTGDKVQAARQVAVLGDRIKDWPWSYVRNPGTVVARLRAGAS